MGSAVGLGDYFVGEFGPVVPEDLFEGCGEGVSDGWVLF
jgi:hypothetical protein